MQPSTYNLGASAVIDAELQGQHVVVDGAPLGLLQRGDGLAGGELAAAVRADGVPEGPRAEAEGGAAAAEQVEAGDALGEHGRRAQRQVRHVRRQMHPGGLPGEHRQQGPGVQEAGLVGVVLDGDQVQPGRLG